jgi:hypothetical protein
MLPKQTQTYLLQDISQRICYDYGFGTGVVEDGAA